MTSTIAVWWAATRPRTLAAAATPVVMGTAMAWRDGAWHAPAAVAALLGALLLQIGTNFANDYFDFVKGADSDTRLGPTRATAAGLVPPAAMRRAFVLTFAIAALVGVYLVTRGGWPIVAIGSAGIACGILYTGGPRPLGYLGLGDVVVLIFFGPVAVAGTHYVQSLQWSGAALVAGLAPGLLATALLAVNNLRDAEQDRVAGKHTLAVRFGAGFAKAEYVGALGMASLVAVALWRYFDGPIWTIAATLAAGATAIPAAATVLRAHPGDRLAGALAATGRLLALYGVAFVVSWSCG